MSLEDEDVLNYKLSQHKLETDFFDYLGSKCRNKKYQEPAMWGLLLLAPIIFPLYQLQHISNLVKFCSHRNLKFLKADTQFTLIAPFLPFYCVYGWSLYN